MDFHGKDFGYNGQTLSLDIPPQIRNDVLEIVSEKIRKNKKSEGSTMI